MRSLILNSSNVVNTNGYKNTYKYTFPVGSVILKDQMIALSKLSLYYSWPNIDSSLYSNNTFSYIFPTASGSTTVSVTLSTGCYGVSDLNAYLQSIFISNGHYLVDGNGNYVYYGQLTTNSVSYAVEWDAFALPTALPSGYTNPGGMSFPTTAKTPQLVISSSGFANVIGFTLGTYPSTSQASTYSHTSDTCPELSPVQGILVTCSLVNNNLCIPNNLLYSFNTAGASFGSTIAASAFNFEWNSVLNGLYQSFTVTLTDTSMNPIRIQDSNLVIQLVLKDKDE